MRLVFTRLRYVARGLAVRSVISMVRSKKDPQRARIPYRHRANLDPGSDDFVPFAIDNGLERP